MKSLLSILFSVFMLGCMLSCEEKKYDVVMPAFAGFSISWYNPDNRQYPSPGDTLVIEAVQSLQGNMINTTKYNWKVESVINSEPNEWSPSEKTIVYDYDRTNPALRYIIPAGTAGNITVSFDASYSFSADCQGITPSRHTDPYIGTITTSASALLGHATGNCTITVM